MNNVYEYKDQAERERIIAENVGRHLLEERNLIDGNFLVFADEIPPSPTILVTVPQEEFESLKRENQRLSDESNANQLALMELHMMLLNVLPDES
ncbi:hypothetical protein QP794_02525 [Paenibacillus sp. UMB7766-LJ446]|uniref:hypothetical protein n=1 Tax=Paenibacillus sp. UMB7766-LJ446 TaxID=3046313 RepID=UPI0025510103|nr:hypothetical protein [Paenibacillus sp. UMB7766-LJ446]MDK8188960.1 hypothetical protein [Paenibacillus sp. UMB7766-LJ446]